jgi:hypothetical protein
LPKPKIKSFLTKVLLEADVVPDFAKKMEGQQDEPSYGGDSIGLR